MKRGGSASLSNRLEQFSYFILHPSHFPHAALSSINRLRFRPCSMLPGGRKLKLS